MRAVAAILGLALAGAAVPGLCADSQEPRAWMIRMAEAVQTLNYEGTFVHLHDGRAETLKVFHRVDAAGRISERLVSLDGAGREIVRDKDEVKCFLPDKRAVFVEKADKQNPFLASLPAYSDPLGEYYFIVDCADCGPPGPGGEVPPQQEQCGYCPPEDSRGQRLLSLETLLIAIKPRDEFRYGYRLWLDRETALPVKTQLLDERGEIIEQVRFTSLSVGDEIPPSAIAPTVDASDYSWYYQPEGEAADAISRPLASWSAASLPPGYSLSRRGTGSEPRSEAGLDHQVYSDGLASISVFVEQGSDAGIEPGLSRLGAANAFTLQAQGYSITAIGEAPALAVEQVARSVQFHETGSGH